MNGRYSRTDLSLRQHGRPLDRRGVPHGSGSVREGNSASTSAPAVTRETRAGARYRGHTESWQTGHSDARAYTITEHSADSLTLTHTHTQSGAKQKVARHVERMTPFYRK